MSFILLVWLDRAWTWQFLVQYMKFCCKSYLVKAIDKNNKLLNLFKDKFIISKRFVTITVSKCL